MAQASADAAQAPRRLRSRIVVVFVLVMAAFASATAYDAWRSYRQVVSATDREMGNLAKALAREAEDTLQTSDLFLRDTANWYRHLRPTPGPEADAMLASRAEGLHQLRGVAIVDAHGVLRFRSQGASPGNADVSDRPYFIAQRDNPHLGVVLSEPLITRSEHRFAVVMSRRLDTPEGSFDGLVQAVVDLEAFQLVYQAIDLGAGSAINLLRDDGTLLVRQPPAAQAVGTRFPELVSAANANAGVLLSPVDRLSRFVGEARVDNFPLVIAVSREERVALEGWRTEAYRVAARTLALMLLGALAVAALVVQLRRVERGERALRQSEERYALAMEGANEGHFDWSLDGGPSFLSPHMKLLHGRGTDAPVTTRAAWLASVNIHPDDLGRMQAAVTDHLEGRTDHYETEYRIRLPDGEWHWLQARGRCMRDTSGNAHRFLGSAIDITARKNAEAEKQQLEVQLRQSQKMEAMGTLAGGIAHDFNNILGAILGYGELAQKAASEGSVMRRYLDNVMHAGDRAKTLVERILAFSRSSVGERSPINVQAVIVETLELLAGSLAPGVRLVERLEAGNAAVVGDATLLHQVAMNLCTNALQAMPAGGVLEVTLDRIDLLQGYRLSHGNPGPGAYVRLAVGDTGSAIDVRTAAGHGTTFTIWLPSSGEAIAPSAEGAVEVPHGHGQTVLIVDDEEPLVALAEEEVAQLGYEPVGFSSSVQALDAFRAAPERFDIVLTDETMPELTGTDLAREIRRLRTDIPIVLMSGYAGAQLHERARVVGIREVLGKPLRSGDIAECFGRVLR
jgi:PAS domain S-box-containing protein